MISIPIILATFFAAGAPLIASTPVKTNDQLEIRQTSSVVRLYNDRNLNPNDYADKGIVTAGECQPLPSSGSGGVSSFELGVWRCRFLQGPNCSGPNQYFDTDWTDLRVGGGNHGYKEDLNDDFTSVICLI